MFISKERVAQETDRWIGAASAVTQKLYWSDVEKRDLNVKATLSIYWSIYVPTLALGYVGSEQKKVIQATELQLKVLEKG